MSGAAPAAAAAQAGPFTDHSRAAADQYGTPAGSNNGGQAGQPTTPPAGQKPPSENNGNDNGNGNNGNDRDNGGREAGPPDSEVGAERRTGVSSGSEQGAPLPLAQPEGGSLPFTGLNLLALVLLGLLLLSAGMALRLAGRARAARRAA